MPLFGKKSAVDAAYDQGQSLAVQVLNGIAYAEGYSAGRGERLDSHGLEIVRWAPRTANAIFSAFLKKPSTASRQINAGELTPSPQLAMAVLLGDLFAFLEWTGAQMDTAYLEFLGSYQRSAEHPSLLALLHESVTDSQDGTSRSFAQRTAETCAAMGGFVSSAGSEANQAGAFGGIIIARCEFELVAGDTIHVGAFDGPEPLRQWLTSAAKLAALARKG